MDSSSQVALVRFQNMAKLVRDMRLPVMFQVHKDTSERDGASTARRYLIIVHVCADYVFPKYFKAATDSDMVLFRGMFLRATFSDDVASDSAQLLHFGLQQAFLPKFENEGQDTSVAQKIEDEADARYMAVSIKHSGSLSTMSHELLGAKNSINNPFTYGAALALHAHYQRISSSGEDAAACMRALLADLKEERLSVSFEVVTRCLGHHGQLPHGEYLVTTSVSRLTPDGQVQVLSWLEALQFCAKHKLPTNDVWLFAGRDSARAAREVLDRVAVSGQPTGEIVEQLDRLAAGSELNVKMPGSYPHHLWQGDRVEGFVVSQGEEVARDGRMASLAEALLRNVVPSDGICEPAYPAALLRPVEAVMGGNALSRRPAAAGDGGQPSTSGAEEPSLAERVAQAVPTLAHMQGSWESLRDGRAGLDAASAKNLHSEAAQVIHRLAHAPVAASAAALVEDAATGASAVSRAALASSSERDALAGKAGSLRAPKPLRYKKKMMMFGKVVGYCMMTFIIRNGLPHVRRSRAEYLQYVTKLTSQWQLTAEQREDCVRFAAAWHRWHDAHVAKDLDSNAYLGPAEQFAEAFLSGTLPQQPDAFRGVLYLEGFDEELAGRVFAALGTTASFGVEWNNTLPELGTAMYSHPFQDGPPPIKGKNRKLFWEKAAPHVKVVHFGMPKRRKGVDEREFRRATGKLESFLRDIEPVRKWAREHGVPLDQRILQLETPLVLPSDALPGNGSSGLTPLVADLELSKSGGQDTNDDGNASPARKRAKGHGKEKHAGAHDDPAPAPPSAAELDDIVKRVVAWVGAGVTQTRDPSLVVAFVSIPGLGKTSLSAKLAAQLGAEAHVVHLQSDALDKSKQKGGLYWTLAAGESVTSRGDGRPTVVLADKNLLDSPPGNFASCSAALSPHSRVLAVVMTDERTASLDRGEAVEDGGGAMAVDGAAAPLVLPFELPLVAAAMMRVGRRHSHPGGLHGRMAHSGGSGCYEIVANFAGAFQGRSAVGLLEHVRAHFRHVVALPVIKSGGADCLPERLATLLDRGVRIGNFGRRRDDQRAFPAGWEDDVRAEMGKPEVAAALAALEVPLESTAEALAAAIRQALAQGDDDAGPAPAPSRAPVRYFAVADFDEAPLAEAFRAAQAQAGVPVMPAKGNLHVTIWHTSDEPTDPDPLPELRAAVGEAVTVKVLSFHLGTKIAAARVVLEGAPEAAYRHRCPHVTMWHDKGQAASGASALFDPGAEGDAAVHRVELPEPITLVGRVTAYR